jgi:hypothetical protein
MPRYSGGGSRQGIALAAAIFALAVVGGIVAAGFRIALLEQQSGRNTLFVAQASEAAEAGLWELLHQAPKPAVESLVVGGVPLSLVPASPFTGVAVLGQISRVADNLYLVRSRASRVDAAGEVLASRSVGLLAGWSGDTLDQARLLLPIRQRAWLQLH